MPVLETSYLTHVAIGQNYDLWNGRRRGLDQPRLQNDRRLTAGQHFREHLTDQFDLDTVEAVRETLL